MPVGPVQSRSAVSYHRFLDNLNIADYYLFFTLSGSAFQSQYLTISTETNSDVNFKLSD